MLDPRPVSIIIGIVCTVGAMGAVGIYAGDMYNDGLVIDKSDFRGLSCSQLLDIYIDYDDEYSDRTRFHASGIHDIRCLGDGGQ